MNIKHSTPRFQYYSANPALPSDSQASYLFASPLSVFVAVVAAGGCRAGILCIDVLSACRRLELQMDLRRDRIERGRDLGGRRLDFEGGRTLLWRLGGGLMM